MVSLCAHLAGRGVCGVLLCWLIRTSAVAETSDRLLDAWLDQQTALRTWSADFIQTRALKALAQPLTARGRVWFAAPDRFRWELHTPRGDQPDGSQAHPAHRDNMRDAPSYCQTIAVRGAEAMLLIYPPLKRVERYPLTSPEPGPWRDAVVLLESGFPRSRTDLEAKFRVLSVRPIAERCEVTLQPKATGVRKLMPQLRLAFATNDLSLRMTELKFADGSILRNEFTNPCLNPKLDAALFEPTLGADFTVVEPLSGRSGRR